MLRAAEEQVRRLRQRIFTPTRAGDPKRVRGLQKLMPWSLSDTLASVRHVTAASASDPWSLAILEPENTRVRTGDRSGRGAFGSDYGAVVGTSS